MIRNVAILMAAGHGSRLGGSVSKQFIPVRGKMLLEYALQTFQAHALIHDIVLVLPEECAEQMGRRLQNHYPKITNYVAGGPERFLSSWAAVQLFKNRPHDNLLLHDAARPLVSNNLITELIDTLTTHQAAITAIPATDTILRVDEKQFLSETLNRAELYYAQTPQAFRASLLYDSFKRYFQTPDFSPTDESGLVAHYRPDIDIRIVEGSPDNFKITYPADLDRLNLILQNLSR